MSRAVPALLSTMLVLSAHALDPSREISQYVHDQWQIEDGLPQNSVHDIAQDRLGFLWLATLEGLVRFDGVRFEVFNKANVEALASNEIRSFHGIGDDVLWIASYGGGLIRMQDGRFRSFGEEDGLSETRVWQISGNEAGEIWLATHQGLFRYRDGEFTRFTREDGLAGDDVRCVLADDDGSVWAGTMNGLSLWDGDGFRTFTTEHGLAHNKVKSLARDGSGRLWIGTHTGLNVLEDGSFATFTETDGLAHESVISLFEDGSGAMWIGTEGGLSRFLDGRISSPAPGHGLSRSIVRSLFEDHEGSLWIGTESGGLRRLRQGKFTPYTSHTGLEAELVWSFQERRDGSLAIGTGDGLAVMRDGRFTHHRRDTDTSNNWIAALLEGRDGTLWVGTNGDGLFHFRDGRFLSFPGREQLAQDYILSLREDGGGDLWIGTRAGLRRLREGVVTRFGREDGLAGDVVRCIHAGGNGDLWIGTGSGISRHRDGAFENFTTRDGLSSNAVFSIHEDRDGTLWFGTYGGGLNRYRDGEFRSVTTRQGLYDDVVYVILEDDDGGLWMTGNKGVFRVDKREFGAVVDGRAERLESPSYGVADGMMSRECNGGLQPAGLRTRDGTMWFPTIRGAVAVDPGNLRSNTVIPPVHVTGMIVDGVEMPPRNGISLPRGTGKLEFHYTALSFEVPKKVLFRYMLEGYDRDWVDAGTRRVAYYTNLPPGEYSFRVRACNNDGVWNEDGAALAFRKLPYFYETAGFTLSMSAGGILALFSLYRIRIRRMEKRENELESLVALRTRELREASLRDSLTGLRNRRFVTETVKPETTLFAERKEYLLRNDGPRPAHPMDNTIGVYIVDIDHFKEINDDYGHDAGDRVLRQFADILRGTLRKDDVVARWGGEEFLVVLKNTSPDYVERFAERIREKVAESDLIITEDCSRTIRRTCSLGYVSFPFHPHAPEMLSFEQSIMLADLGLYHAKRNGRNRAVGVLPTRSVPTPEQLTRMLTSLRFGRREGLVRIRT